jgi:hypothetical protein
MIKINQLPVVSHQARAARPPRSLRRALRLGLWLAAMLLLCACQSAPPAPSDTPPSADVRFETPEAVVQNFLKDLSEALRDRRLTDDDARAAMVERLANYFAPNEREDQREAIGRSLSVFAASLAQLKDDQTLVFEVRGISDFRNFKKIADDGQRALIRANGASIYVLIARGNLVDFEQEVPLDQIIGRSDGTIPTRKIETSWYLTEG